MWKRARIGILLCVLAIVATNAWLERRRTASWRDSLYAGIYPVAADDSAATRAYVTSLGREAFEPLEDFFAREGRRHGLALEQPFRVELFPVVATPPPSTPDGAGPLATAWWSLQMRWYAWHSAAATGRPVPNVRVFVLYHDPVAETRLPHSLGLQKGQIGLVHAFASGAMGSNNLIVIAHELLHTVGAGDKYDPATDAPRYPEGYADPAQEPRYPQHRAEIMAGRRALSPKVSEMPETLDDCVVGDQTAIEVGWSRR